MRHRMCCVIIYPLSVLRAVAVAVSTFGCCPLVIPRGPGCVDQSEAGFWTCWTLYALVENMNQPAAEMTYCAFHALRHQPY